MSEGSVFLASASRRFWASLPLVSGAKIAATTPCASTEIPEACPPAPPRLPWAPPATPPATPPAPPPAPPAPPTPPTPPMPCAGACIGKNKPTPIRHEKIGTSRNCLSWISGFIVRRGLLELLRIERVIQWGRSPWIISGGAARLARGNCFRIEPGARRSPDDQFG